MRSSNGSGSSGVSLKLIRPYFSQEHFPDFLAENSLRPLSPLMAPTSPTLFALSGESVTAKKRVGRRELFDALIGDARVLFQEYLDDPDRFEDGTGELLQEMVNGRKKFSDLERKDKDLMNRAAIDFASSKGPAPKKERAPRHQSRELPAAAQMASGELAWSDDGKHSPPTPDIPNKPATFWWRKTTK